MLRWMCIFLVLTLVGEALPKKIPRWWMKVAQRQGPNACVVEEVPNTSTEFWTECRYWLNRNICGRKTRLRFECCEGFERIEGADGCTRVKPLRNLLETAESLGATKWAQYIRESGLAGELESAVAYTLFAPTNEAFDNLRRSLSSQLESYRGNPNNPILLYHILPTKLLSEDFQANTMAETRHQGHNIRINKYSNGMTTINCALLIRKDQHATNGVVHVIDNVLDPSVGILQNVADMVLNDGRFSVLAEILEKSGYINVLRTMQNSITILAPSDEAFQKLPESRREKIINDREARLALLQNHVIPHVICESAITGEHRVRTVSDNRLTFNCDIQGTYVETTKLRGNFNLGKNGIIHMIDDVLLPDRAKNLIELAESRQLWTFVELVRKAGLEETLSHTGDYTFFVPDEAAWYSLDSDVLLQARRDMELAGQLVRFHGAYGRHLTNAITDNQAIMSLDEENPVRLQVWRRALGVEDAKITEKDIEAQNGVIHIIDKVIVPSNQSIEATLGSIPGQRFSIFQEALQKVAESSVLSLGPGDEVFYTFFVPNDATFNRLDQETLSRIRNDENYMTDVIKSHIAINMFPTTSFEAGLIYTIDGMAAPFDVKKEQNEELNVNGARVSSSHMSAKGVIHVVDQVFLPENSYTYSSVRRVTTTTYGGRGYGGSSSSSSSVSSSRSSRRSYKKTVTFDQSYGGGESTGRELPAFPQGSVSPARARRRKTGSRRRPSTSSPSPSSSITTTSTTTSPDVRSNPASYGGSTALEETHLQGSGFSARESEASVNSLGSSSSSSSSSSASGGWESYDNSEPYGVTEPGIHDNYGSFSASRSNSHDTDHLDRSSDGSYAVHGGSYSSASYNLSSYPSSVLHSFDSHITHGESDDVHGSRGSGSYSGSSSSSPSSHIDTSSPHRGGLHGSSSQDAHSSSSSSSSTSYGYGDYNHLATGMRNEASGSADLGSHGSSYVNTSRGDSHNYGSGSSYSRGYEYSGASASGSAASSSSADHSSRPGYPEGSGSGTNTAGAHGFSSSQTYTYHVSGGGARDGSPTHDGQPLHGLPDAFATRSTFTIRNSTTTHRKNTIGPISPDGGRFSYVGHPYGADVVGHGDTEGRNSGALPFSLGSNAYQSSGSVTSGVSGVPGGRSTYEYRQTSHVEESAPVRGDSDITRGGISSSSNTRSSTRSSTSTTSRRRYGVSRTVVYPAGSNQPMSRSEQSFSYPMDSGHTISSIRGGKQHSSSVSAYALTADDTEYADGHELAESKAADELTITHKEAAAMRRRWRRKRHHKHGGKRRRGSRREGRRRNVHPQNAGGASQ